MSTKAETVAEGEKLIAETIQTMGERERATSAKLIDQVRHGQRDCLI
jgi:hypothetical protein